MRAWAYLSVMFYFIKECHSQLLPRICHTQVVDMRGCDITPCSSVCGEGGQTLTQFGLPLRCRTSHPEPAQSGGSGLVTCNQLAYCGAASGRPVSSSACLSEHFLCPTGTTKVTLQKATCCHHLWYHICCHAPFPPSQGSQACFPSSIPTAT